MAKPMFPSAVSRFQKTSAGRTSAESTPLDLRARGVHVGERLARYVRERAHRRLGKFAYHAERLTVRLEDVNGPKGGDDTTCNIKVVLSGAPSIVVEERRATAREAFDVTLQGVERALRRETGRRGWSAKRGRRARAAAAPADAPAQERGSVIGRRVGRAESNLRRAADRPEKLRGDASVDTSQPNQSATDRRAGGTSTAARNTMRSAPRATSTLEDSAQDRPSRKSTRKSANRARHGTAQQRRAVDRTRRR